MQYYNKYSRTLQMVLKGPARPILQSKNGGKEDTEDGICGG